MTWSRSIWLAATLVLLYAGLLIGQVLVRPAVGIADNGDFPKMAGPFALGPAGHDWASNRFKGFFYSYSWAERNRYTPGIWSSELLMVKLARPAARISSRHVL